jgi:hypothetical protein
VTHPDRPHQDRRHPVLAFTRFAAAPFVFIGGWAALFWPLLAIAWGITWGIDVGPHAGLILVCVLGLLLLACAWPAFYAAAWVALGRPPRLRRHRDGRHEGQGGGERCQRCRGRGTRPRGRDDH